MKTPVHHTVNFIRLLVFAAVLIGLFFIQIANAQLDPTFGMNGAVITDVFGNDRTVETFVLPNDKTLVFASGVQNGQTKYFLIRYNADGTTDPDYGASGIVYVALTAVPNAIFTKAARQTDGKIVLTGSAGSDSLIVRINENGLLDTGFEGGGIQRPNFHPNGDDKIDALAIQPDGKIVIASSFSYFSNFLYFVRYLPNGTLDPSFGNGGLISHNNLLPSPATANEILFQSNGKIITRGFYIRRFNADGTIDNGFSVITAPENINSPSAPPMVIQADDKILIAGSVYKDGGLERFSYDVRVYRYTADGAADGGFGSGGAADVDVTSYFNDLTSAIAVQPDGQILIAARTQVQPNRTRIRGEMLSIIRLSPNGAVNGKFLITNAADFRAAIKILPNGKILIVSGKNYFSANDDLLLTRLTGIPLQNYQFLGVPFDFVNGDGIADVAVYRPSNLTWYFDPNSGTGSFFGAATDIRVPSDYIGDLRTDLAVFRPSNGTWYIGKNTFNPAQNFIAVQWGQAGDIPVPADYDGDGKSDIAVFRPSNGGWYVRNSRDNSSTSYIFGASEDKPVAGDYDGDSKSDIAVYRPSNGTWYFLKSVEGFAAVRFGASEDVPVQEDYDGDLKTDVAVFRPSNGVWYRLNSSDGSFAALAWGFSTDKLVPAEYDGDGKADIAVWRPSNGQWYIFKSTTNSLLVYNWGTTNDLPIQERK